MRITSCTVLYADCCGPMRLNIKQFSNFEFQSTLITLIGELNKMAIIMITQNKRLVFLLLGIPLLLLIPLISMQLTDQVHWSPLDFLIAGVLLLGTGLGCELVLQKVKKFRDRLGLCLLRARVYLAVYRDCD